MRTLAFGLGIAFSLTGWLGARAESQCGRSTDFNVCILEAVDLIHTTRERGGYSDNYFTKHLDYGPNAGAVKASHPTDTMCVAAVSEVLIEALNIYFRNTADESPFRDLPAKSWNGWSATDIRTSMWEDGGSNSAGYAFNKFGIGERLQFKDLKPGDFVSFDRTTGTGHSTIFLGFVGKDFKDLPSYSDQVVGFRYYSSQSSGVSGFAYRYGFFGGTEGQGVCTNAPEKHNGIFVDCFHRGISWADTKNRGGRVWHPSKWHVAESVMEFRRELEATLTIGVLSTLQYEKSQPTDADVREKVERALTRTEPRKTNPKFLMD